MDDWIIAIFWTVILIWLAFSIWQSDAEKILWEKKYCIQEYWDIKINNIPWKCLKYLLTK